MTEPRKKRPQSPRNNILGPGKTSNLTVSVYDGDHELVAYMVKFMGSSKADVVRTAIRAYAQTCVEIERRLR